MRYDNNNLTIKAADDVRELERYLNDFSVFLPLPVCMVTPTRSIVDINSAFTKLTGYTSLDIIGQRLTVLFEDGRVADAIFQDLDKTDRMDRETEILLRDKRVIPVNLSVATRRDDENNVIGYFFALSDISELKKLQGNLEHKVRERTRELEQMQKILLKTLDQVKTAKRRIEREKDKTSAIIANFVDPVMVVDNKGRMIFLNPAARKAFRLSGKSLESYVISRDGRFSCADFKDVLKIDFRTSELKKDAQGNPSEEEFIISRNKTMPKKVSPFQAAAMGITNADTVYKVITAPVRDDKGALLGRMKIFYDLTREKMIDLMKSEFISIAAHQLRTPLSAIKWSLRMALDGDAGKLKEEQKKILLKGYISNERVINLINEMLSASRIEEGKYGYTFGQEDCAGLVSEAADGLQSQIEAKNIKFSFQKPKAAVFVRADHDKLRLAIAHLLENAVKYTPEHGTVSVSLAADAKTIKLRVSDNGVGIPAQEMAKLYSKFFRAENVVRMQTEGSGLGLYISKNIIEGHGGAISCQSREGKGTEFTVTLPAKTE